MMPGFNRFLLIFALFLGSVHAASKPIDDDRRHGGMCLTDKQALDIANTFENFYMHFDVAEAERLIADDFQSFSDSNGQSVANFTVCLSLLLPIDRMLSSAFAPSRAYFLPRHSPSNPFQPLQLPLSGRLCHHSFESPIHHGAICLAASSSLQHTECVA